MEIKVLGMGCLKCHQLHDSVQEALRGAGLEADVEKVEKLDAILGFGVAMTPALVIDGQVKSAGRLPARDELITWLTTAALRG